MLWALAPRSASQDDVVLMHLHMVVDRNQRLHVNLVLVGLVVVVVHHAAACLVVRGLVRRLVVLRRLLSHLLELRGDALNPLLGRRP